MSHSFPQWAQSKSEEEHLKESNYLGGKLKNGGLPETAENKVSGLGLLLHRLKVTEMPFHPYLLPREKTVGHCGFWGISKNSTLGEFIAHRKVFGGLARRGFHTVHIEEAAFSIFRNKKGNSIHFIWIWQQDLILFMWCQLFEKVTAVLYEQLSCTDLIQWRTTALFP